MIHPLEACLNLFISIARPEALKTVSHGSEVPYVYGAPLDESASATSLSSIMIDYWVSFATSLDPNDGRGNPRKCFIDHSTPC